MWHNTWCATKLQTGYYIPFFSWNSVLFPQGKFLSIRNDTSLVITCWKEVENSTFSAPLKFLLQFRILLKSNWWNIFFPFALKYSYKLVIVLSKCELVWHGFARNFHRFTCDPVCLCYSSVMDISCLLWFKCIKLFDFCFHLQVM